MRSGKLFTAFTTALLTSALFVMPVSAHGHHGNNAHYNQTSENTDCPVCTVEDCTEEGRHTHDGHDYCGYDHESGYCDGSCETAVSEKTVPKKNDSGNRVVKQHRCHR